MFYVGQKVKVKPRSELKKHFHVMPDMLIWCDQTVTIKWIDNSGGSIHIAEDTRGWCWSPRDFDEIGTAINISSDNLLAFLTE